MHVPLSYVFVLLVPVLASLVALFYLWNMMSTERVRGKFKNTLLILFGLFWFSLIISTWAITLIYW